MGVFVTACSLAFTRPFLRVVSSYLMSAFWAWKYRLTTATKMVNAGLKLKILVIILNYKWLCPSVCAREEDIAIEMSQFSFKKK